jgi:hypothetical protein
MKINIWHLQSLYKNYTVYCTSAILSLFQTFISLLPAIVYSLNLQIVAFSNTNEHCNIWNLKIEILNILWITTGWNVVETIAVENRLKQKVKPSCRKMVMVASKICDINCPSSGLFWDSGSDTFIVKLGGIFMKAWLLGSCILVCGKPNWWRDAILVPARIGNSIHWLWYRLNDLGGEIVVYFSVVRTTNVAPTYLLLAGYLGFFPQN